MNTNYTNASNESSSSRTAFGIAGALGTAALVSGAGLGLALAGEPASAPASTVEAPSGYEVVITPTEVMEAQGLTAVHDVQGTFSFNQEGTSPNDEMFNVFGTAILSMCSKPAADLAAEQTGVANYLINIGGHVKESFTVDLSELSGDEVTELMVCSCSTGSPFGQAEVTGVPLSAVVELAGILPGTASVAAISADGYGEAIPLEYALSKDALLVYRVNGEDLVSSEGSSVQLWLPETVARYFTRNIASIEFSEDEAAAPVGVEPMYRNKVVLKNAVEGMVIPNGNEVVFEGVADDMGSPVVAVEFSFDGGDTWTQCATNGATADLWVNWQFATTFDEPGNYEMTVRARTADDVVSPLYASVAFTVE